MVVAKRPDVGQRWIGNGTSGILGIARVYGDDNAQADANAALIVKAVNNHQRLIDAVQKIADWEPSASPNEPNGMSIIDAIDICKAALAGI